MTDLDGIVSAAIHLHDMERGLDNWESEVGIVRAGLAEAAPSDIGRLCRHLSMLRIETDSRFRISCAVHAEIRDRAERGVDLAGADRMVAQQAEDAKRLGDRMLALRAKLRRLDDRIGETVSSFRDESVEARLLRIAGDGSSARDIDDILVLVRQDHDAIADAVGDWRTMHTSGPILLIAGSTSREDVAAALRRLETAGSATRWRSLMLGSRWTLHRPAMRKAA